MCRCGIGLVGKLLFDSGMSINGYMENLHCGDVKHRLTLLLS